MRQNSYYNSDQNSDSGSFQFDRWSHSKTAPIFVLNLLRLNRPYCVVYCNSKDFIFNVSLSIQNVIIAGTSKASSVEQDRIVGVDAKPLLLTFLITMRILTP